MAVETSWATPSPARHRAYSSTTKLPFELQPVPTSKRRESRPQIQRSQSSLDVESFVGSYASSTYPGRARTLTFRVRSSQVFLAPSASTQDRLSMSRPPLSPHSPTSLAPTRPAPRSSSMRTDLRSAEPPVRAAARSYTDPARLEDNASEIEITLTPTTRPRRSLTTGIRPRTSPETGAAPRFGDSSDAPALPAFIGRHMVGSTSLVSLHEVTRSAEKTGGIRELARKASNKLLRRNRNSFGGSSKHNSPSAPPVPSLPSSSDIAALSPPSSRSRPDPDKPLFDQPSLGRLPHSQSSSSFTKSRKKPVPTSELNSSTSSLSISSHSRSRSRSHSNSSTLASRPIRGEMPPVPSRSPDLLSMPLCVPLRKDSLASTSSSRSNVTTPDTTPEPSKAESSSAIRWPSALKQFGFIDRSFFDDPYAHDSEPAPSSRPSLADYRQESNTTLRVMARRSTLDASETLGEESARDWAQERQRVQDQARARKFLDLLDREDQEPVKLTCVRTGQRRSHARSLTPNVVSRH